jgi:hypothetical protein
LVVELWKREWRVEGGWGVDWRSLDSEGRAVIWCSVFTCEAVFLELNLFSLFDSLKAICGVSG